MIILIIIAIHLLMCGIGVGLVLLNAWLRELNEKQFDLTKHLDKDDDTLNSEAYRSWHNDNKRD